MQSDNRNGAPAHQLQVLLVEDNYGDARLFEEALRDADPMGFTLTHVDRLSAARAHVVQTKVDVILLDLSLPDSQGFETFHQLHASAPTVPVMVLTGLNDEVVAVKAVREGAQDYLVKGHVEGATLVRAMRYAIERNDLQQERDHLIEELQQAITQIKTLSGMLPICANCKNVRDDKGYWAQIETYVQQHSEAEFSHGICPDCFDKLYPELVGEELTVRS